MKFTVFGAAGFIGSPLVAHLRARGHEVQVPSRDGAEMRGRALGHAIYAIGLTGDFRTRPFDTVEAHVGALARLLEGADYESWLFLSSTRVYGTDPSRATCREDDPITVTPSADAVYDLSKLLGESLCMALPRTRIARLSNVYGAGQGPQTFLGAIVRELGERGEVTIREAPQSSKDYVSLASILPVIESIALRGRHRIYNVASGRPTTHREIAERLAALTGGSVRFAEGAAARQFPRIDISRIAEEFSFAPSNVASDLEALVSPSAPPAAAHKAPRT
jgi:nucleoside-diphosphate-sugar epimerase